MNQKETITEKKKIVEKNKNRKKVVEIKDLKVVYNAGKSNENQALKDVTFDIYEQEYIIFFGPSGCGKSTILNVIAGLETPSAGKVLVETRDIIKFSPKQLADFHRNTIGMVFQSYNLISTLTVLENVGLPLVFDRVKSQERKKKSRTLLKRLGLEVLEKRLPQELSGGQQQRVGIARALINDPPIILADEAVGNLDSVSAKNVLSIIDALNTEEKKTIISVTHNPEHLYYADRIFYVKDGSIVKVEENKRKKMTTKKTDTGGSLKSKGMKERTELDLLLNAYPDLSSMQFHIMMAPFKAKMLVAYLISQFESKEIEDLENKIADRLLNRIEKEKFFDILDKPIDEGGIGLNKQTAEKFSEIVEEVIEKAEFIREKHQQLEEGEEDSIKSIINEIRVSLLEEYDGDLSLDQVEALNRGIEYRVTSKINKAAFKEYLNRSLKKGGVGFRKGPAKKLARKMELIMLVEYGK